MALNSHGINSSYLYIISVISGKPEILFSMLQKEKEERRRERAKRRWWWKWSQSYQVDDSGFEQWLVCLRNSPSVLCAFSMFCPMLPPCLGTPFIFLRHHLLFLMNSGKETYPRMQKPSNLRFSSFTPHFLPVFMFPDRTKHWPQT